MRLLSIFTALCMPVKCAATATENERKQQEREAERQGIT